MGELRRDIVTGHWVVMATDRAKRPTDFALDRPPVLPAEESECPFCPGHERMTPLEVLAIRPAGAEPDTPGWQVRVFPNKFPAFETGGGADPVEGTFPATPAEGEHEVIVHSPDHSGSLGTMLAEEVELVLRVYRHRYRVACGDPHVRYVHLIVNHGRRSGASLEHSHSQLFGVPVVPPLVALELAGASRHLEKTGDCVFCRVVSDELEEGRRVVASNGAFVAIAPFASRFPFETWILPRVHRESFAMIDGEQLKELAVMLRDVLGRYYRKLGDPPYNYYIHSAPCDGREHPHYHWHLEVAPRLTTLGGFELGTGMMINVTTPEAATEFLHIRV